MEVDSLLGASYSTLDIKEDKVTLSQHNLMYQVLQEPKGRVFSCAHGPFGILLVENERKPFFSQRLKCRFPFE